jgi:hypothetical protein
MKYVSFLLTLFATFTSCIMLVGALGIEEPNKNAVAAAALFAASAFSTGISSIIQLIDIYYDA